MVKQKDKFWNALYKNIKQAELAAVFLKDILHNIKQLQTAMRNLARCWEASIDAEIAVRDGDWLRYCTER